MDMWKLVIVVERLLLLCIFQFIREIIKRVGGYKPQQVEPIYSREKDIMKKSSNSKPVSKELKQWRNLLKV